MKFQLRPVQYHYFMRRHRKTVIPKARQLGFTTFHVIDYLDDCLFSPDPVDVAIIADTLPHVRKIFKKAKVAWDNFPLRGSFSAHTESKNELSFSTGSTMEVASDIRSGTYQRLHLSESSKIDRKYPLKAEEILTGCIPAVPKEGLISNESTGRGDSGSFYDAVEEARSILHQGREPYSHEYKLFFYSWTLDRKYEIHDDIPLDAEAEDYMNKHRLTLPKARFWMSARKQYGKYVYQEYPTTLDEAFICADGSYFDLDHINDRIQLVRKPIKAGRDFIQWKEPEAGMQYVIGCDVAEGYGGDSSTICVLDRKGNQVYEFCSNSIKVADFAVKIAQIGKMYNYAVVGVERNNHGHAVLGFLNHGIPGRMGAYRNLYRQKSIDQATRKPTLKLGWHTNAVSKPFMLDELDAGFEEEDIKINSIPALKEMRDFGTDDLAIRTIGTSRHFDRMIALAIAWQMRKERSRVSGATTKEDLGL